MQYNTTRLYDALYKDSSLYFMCLRDKSYGWCFFFSTLDEELKKISDVLYEDALDEAIIYPPMPLIFNAFEKTPFSQVKVVVIGQDPYFNPKEAMGLSFSVPDDIKIPSSLLNIRKELKADGFQDTSRSGNLTCWAKQGVFLINAALTVRDGERNCYSKLWENFTTSLISYIDREKEHVVFILWGRFAQGFEGLISNKHHIIKSAHPSGLSAHRGFFGSRPFSKTNDQLKSWGVEEIDWSLV